jgi:hypothetical protein
MPRRDTFRALRDAARSEAAALVRLAAGSRGYDDTIQACIIRAANKLGWSYRRTEGIWRKEAKLIESFEMDALRNLKRENGRRKKRPAIV